MAIKPEYAVTRFPTPLFKTPDIATQFGGEDGDTLALDDKGLLRSAETVLFPKSKLIVIDRIAGVLKVRTTEYPYGDFYADERFLSLRQDEPEERKKTLPEMLNIIKNLKEMEHFPYIWGGNWPKGIDEMTQFYPSRTVFHELKLNIRDIWRFRGCDCTGLPYYLTNGVTPRNSSSLVTYGKPVNIEGLTAEGIIERLESMDFIVWDGHLVWVLDPEHCIESRYPFGLIKTKLTDRLAEIMEQKRPVNDWTHTNGERFVVRRWHPDNISSSDNNNPSFNNNKPSLPAF